MKFKVGDKVKIVASTYQTGEVHGPTQHTVGKIGTIKRADEVSQYPYLVDFGDGDKATYIESNLKLVNKSIYDLQTGDVVIDDDGDRRRVAGVAGDVVFLYPDDTKKYDMELDNYSKIYLDENGYRIVTEEETTEMTVAEVEALVGKKVKIVVESDRLDIAIANLRDAINVLVLERSPCLNTSGTVEEHDSAMPEPIGCSLHYRRLYEFTNQINYLRETVRTAPHSVKI